MIAETLQVMIANAAPADEIVILYVPAAFEPPPAEPAPFLDFHRIPGLQGWTSYPERPLSLVLGLGYEAEHAIGAIEYLDPSGIWMFLPVGKDDRFRAALKRMNMELRPLVDVRHTIDYFFTSPTRLYVDLRMLVETLSNNSRVAIVPNGSKLFAAVAVLTKLEVGDEVFLWRCSSHEGAEKIDRHADDLVVRLHYPVARLQGCRSRNRAVEQIR